MPDDSALLQEVLQHLDHASTPNDKWPDAKGEYWALCPFHPDTHPTNFSVSARGFQCFACGEKGSIRRLAKIYGIEVPDERPGLTLADYAKAKALDVARLQSWGVREMRSKQGKPYVVFPYRDVRGKQLDPRFRFGMSERPKGRRGSRVNLYGLWRLREFRAGGWILLVEGESDCHTAWSYDLPAIGIPGATSFKAEWAPLLDGFDVHVWHEHDQGGDTLVSKLKGIFPEGKSLEPPAGIKDVSAAHLKGMNVAQLLDELRRDAIPLADALPEAVKDAHSLAELAPWVHEKLAQNSRRQTKMEVAEALGAWLVRERRLIVDIAQDSAKGGRAYLATRDHELWPLDRDDQNIRLSMHNAGLNGTEATFAFVLEHLVMTALKSGRRVRLARWQKAQDNALYVSCGASHMARMNDSGLEVIDNGTDDVWFAGDAALPTWRPVDNVFPLDLPAFSPCLEAQAEVSEYTPDVQRDLLAVWLASLLSGLRPLPILVCLGQRGGGKSTLARAILRTLLGPSTELTTLSDDKRDLEVLLTSSPVAGLDNVDGQVPDWLPDLIAAAATGVSIDKRQLYTDAQRISRPVTASLMITTRSGGFARPDVAERSLPILTGQFEDERRLGDTDLVAEVDAHRDGVLSWATRAAWQLLQMRHQAPAGLPLRFQDFAKSVWAYLTMQGRSKDTEDALLALRSAQALTVGEADELAEAIITNIDHLQDWTGSAADLVRELGNLGADLPYLGGGKAIARRIRELRPTLALAGINVWEGRHKNRPSFTLRTPRQLTRTDNMIDRIVSDDFKDENVPF